MKALVLGGSGQLGLALVDTVPGTTNCRAVNHAEVDITDADAVLSVCHEFMPDIIINAAAYTAVDQAESKADLAREVNVQGPENVALAAKNVGAHLIHLSTDFIFDGKSSTPYKPGAASRPLGIYGQTKRDGELKVLETLPDEAIIVRTAWVYGAAGSNFVKTMIRLMREREEVSVVADQIGTPTWTKSLASVLWTFAVFPKLNGVYHWTDAGEASWYEFAKEIQKEALSHGMLRSPVKINAISTTDFPTAAARPRYSVLDCSKTCEALGVQQSDWQDNLHQVMKEMRT